MRILVAGARNFTQSYRIDRALLKAAIYAGSDSEPHTVITIGERRRGANHTAAVIASEMSWDREKADSVDAANAELCLAFLTKGDEDENDAARIARQARAKGMPVWRYFQCPPESAPIVASDGVELDPDLPVTLNADGSLTATLNDRTYTFVIEYDSDSLTTGAA